MQQGYLGGDRQPPTTDDEEEVMFEGTDSNNVSGYEGDMDRGIMSSNRTKFQKRKSLRESRASGHPITSEFMERQNLN